MRTYRFPIIVPRIFLACILATCWQARAEDATPVRLVTPYPAGGPTDVVARVIAQPLSEELGRPVIVDNRAGASGTIGAGAVARAAPDGTSLLINTSIHVILPHLMTLPYDSVKDFTPLAQINTIPFVLVVNKDLPFKSVADVIAYAKDHPGKLNYASASLGSSSQLAAEQFKKLAGIDITHVPYKGSAPAITDMIAGRVEMMFEQGPSIFSFLKGDRLRALAVTSAERSKALPDLPTFAEIGYPELTYSNWQGVWGPPKMSAQLVEKLVSALHRTMQRPSVRQRLIELGTEPSDLVGPAFQSFTKQQSEYVGSIVKSAKVKLE